MKRNLTLKDPRKDGPQGTRYGLRITTYKDFSFSGIAEHYYGRIRKGGYKVDRCEVELYRTLSAEDAVRLNVKDQCDHFKPGDQTIRFDSYGDVLEAGIRTALEKWGPEIILELGDELDFGSTEIPLSPWKEGKGIY